MPIGWAPCGCVPTSGAVINSYTNLPFGDCLDQNGGSNCDGLVGGSPAHFTDQDRDTETGLDHFLFRQYSAVQGRWMRPDPAGMAAVDSGNPQTWNQYTYVANNPVNATDPLGLELVLVFIDAGGGGDPIQIQVDSDALAGLNVTFDQGGNVTSYSNPSSPISFVDSNGKTIATIGPNTDFAVTTAEVGNMTVNVTDSPSNLVSAADSSPQDNIPVPLGITRGNTVYSDGRSEWSHQVLSKVGQMTGGFTKAVNCGTLAAASNIPFVNSVAQAPSYPGLIKIPGAGPAFAMGGAVAGQISKGTYSLSITNNPGPTFNGPFPEISEKAAPLTQAAEDFAPFLAVANSGAVAYQCYHDPNQ